MIGGTIVILEYEKPIAEVILLCSVAPLAEDVEPDGPSGFDEGFEVWPED